MKKLLLRKKDSEIAGVCGGLGDYFNIDETIFRIIFFVGIFTPFPAIFTYILLWIIIPKEIKSYESN
jgi:phage shock protein PspC (stress-responsive transcriptional regulator)